MTKKERLEALNRLAEKMPERVVKAVTECPDVFTLAGLEFEFDKWPNPTRVEFKWQ